MPKEIENTSEIDFFNEKDSEHLTAMIESLKFIKEYINPDLVFIALHGGYGEDGLVQDVMNHLGLKYTGSGAVASKLAMNKEMAKKIIRLKNVPTLDSVLLKDFSEEKMDKVKELGLPLIVKPNNGGSSVALKEINDFSELENAINEVFKVDSEVLVEPFVKGREITVSILAGKSYPIVEIRPKHELYDYTCKYTGGMSEYFCPAPISEELTKEIQESALACYEALGLEVYSRIDFLLDANNNYFCLEANSLPGMTATSLVPKSVKAENMSFEKLIENIINESLNKK
jgi:D-alanine-D-alanine ligase